MCEISRATHEQAAGMSQIGEAVSTMDKVTQQNATLVEEMASAASSLNSQARDLVQLVSFFKIHQALPTTNRQMLALS
jgi:methyl-accepting chemotaxis protein